MKKLLAVLISLFIVSSCIDSLSVIGKNCDSPHPIQVAASNTDKVTLYWEKNLNATSYQIDYRKKGTGGWIIKTTKDTFFTINNIQEPAIYEWRLRTNCKGVWSDYTSVKHFSMNSSVGRTPIEKNKSHVRLYPNPANDVLNIECRNLFFKPETIQLINLNGEVLLEHTGNCSTKLNMGSILNGIYFVSLSNQKNVYLHKVVVSH
ncbi:MAG: T9SS type A sorting domain-containing protein [Chitinophagales bacterium]